MAPKVLTSWSRSALSVLPTSQDLKSEALATALVALPLLLYYVSSTLVLALLATLAFLLAAWRRLDLGLMLVLVAAPFYRFPKALDLGQIGALAGRTTPVELSLAEYALGVCVLAWLARRAFSAPGRPLPTALAGPSWPLWAPAALLIGVATLSLLFTQHLHVALREFRVVIVEPAIYYLLLVQTLRDERDVTRFLYGLVLLGLGIALYGLYHYFLVGVVEATGGVRRILAVYHSPNALALFLGRVIPVAMGLMLASAITKRDWRLSALLGAATLVMMVCFYLTFSRGALLGLGAALLFLLAWLNPRVLLLALALGLVLALAALPFLPWDRLLAPTPIAQRLLVWQAALAMALDHPITGVGLDNFLYYYPQYMLPQAALEPDISHPHNLLLDFWARLGILGLVAILGLEATFWRIGAGLMSGDRRQPGYWLALALMASMADFLAHGLIDNSYFLIDLAYIFWLTYGLMVVLHRDTPRASLTTGSPPV